jgi:hypothetical protein
LLPGLQSGGELCFQRGSSVMIDGTGASGVEVEGASEGSERDHDAKKEECLSLSGRSHPGTLTGVPKNADIEKNSAATLKRSSAMREPAAVRAGLSTT